MNKWTCFRNTIYLGAIFILWQKLKHVINHCRPSTTTKLTTLTIFFHIQVVTTSKLTIFFHLQVVTTSKLTIFFHLQVVTTSKLTIFFHLRVVTICFVQLQSYQDVELFPYFTQKKGFVSMHNSTIML